MTQSTARDLVPLQRREDRDVPDALGRLRSAPHNIDAEKALLGAIMVNNEALDRVAGFLKAEHFFDPLHAQIFETASKLIGAGKQATPVTLRTYFENHEAIDQNLTVAKYLGQLAIQATTIINAKDYGQTIYDLSLRRQLITIGEEVVNVAYDSPVDFPPEKQIQETETKLFALAETGKFGQGFLGFNEALRGAIEMANNAYARQGGLSGISSGLRDLDGRMGGLQASDLIVLAGRPSMGKTSLVTNIAYNVAKARYKSIQEKPDLAPDDPAHDGAVVAFFSLEMSAEQLATRILSEQAEIGSEKIRRGMIDENEFKRLVQVSQDMAAMPLYIDQMGGITMAQVAARCRKLKRQKGLGLVIVDYLQLLSGGGGSQMNRVQEITQITTGLKALSDLRESGSIEQDADVVMFVFREEYYIERTKPNEGTPEFQEWLAKMQMVTGRAEVIIGKQRHGPVGTVHLAFEGMYTRFSDLAKDAYIPERFE
jgi:replicative DNA helicase